MFEMNLELQKVNQSISSFNILIPGKALFSIMQVCYFKTNLILKKWYSVIEMSCYEFKGPITQ